MTVLIYQDYVHNNGLLLRALDEHFHAVNFCDADDIRNGILDSASLFVMPGGADLYYCEKLNGAGNAAIRKWVENGGTYLGICAGAYYACRAIEWAKDTPHEIKGPRELDFFPGTAIGPLYELIERPDMTGSLDGCATLRYNDGNLDLGGNVYYSGGPAFIGNTDNVQVLASYMHSNGPYPAIVECKIGKGKAILVGPHLESGADVRPRATYTYRNGSRAWQDSIVKKLEPHRDIQKKIWQAVLERCSAKTGT